MTVPSDGGVWLGLDLGTGGARAVAVTGTGEPVGSGRCGLTSNRDGARHEQEPREWWVALGQATRAALREVPDGAVRGLAVCSTSGTVALVDAGGEPLGPALMYDDTRAGAEAERARRLGAEVWERLGHWIQPSWGLAKSLRLAEKHRDTPRARLTHQADFVTGRLVGEPVATDSSHALKSGYDLFSQSWPAETLSRLGIPGEMLPPVVRPGTALGTVCRAAADATGVPAGTTVYAGMTDGCAAQLASGSVSPGSWNSVLGTTLVLKGVTTSPIRDPAGAVYSHRSPDGTWLPGGASSVGGGAIEAAFPRGDFAELDTRAAAYEPAPLLAYPLAARGERFPFVAPDAESFVLGRDQNPVAGSSGPGAASPDSDVALYAALLQGVALVERLCLDYLHGLGAEIAGPLTLTGGATRSDYWSRLRADVLGRPVQLPEQAEPAFGMALLAAHAACGDDGINQTAQRMVRTRVTFHPRPEQSERFNEPYVRLVDELERRGWLPAVDAAHARESI